MKCRHPRSSFTLVELMVVITIIAILATISLQVVGGLISQARESATKATITKVQGLLNTRAQAFDRLTQRRGFVQNSVEFDALKKSYPGMNAQLQSALAKKFLQIRFFPQRAGEIYDWQTFPNMGAAQPGEVFFAAITGNTLGDAPVATDAFSASEIVTRADANGIAQTQLVDAWGTPLRFYRWPTRLFRSAGQTGANAVGPITPADVALVQGMFATLPVFSGNLIQDLARDPDDPLQNCLTAIPNFETTPYQLPILPAQTSGQTTVSVNMHTPATYHIFLVVSAGPDKEFGIYPPDDVLNFGHLAQPMPGGADAMVDNIVSLSIRAGGK